MIEFNHFNFNVLNLEKSLITLEMKNSILHSRQMSMMLFIRNMKRWDAFATKILLWESILSMIQTDIGLKSFR